MFKAYGLYSHIRANRIRSVLLLVSFVALLQAVLFSLALLLEAFNGGSFADIAIAAWGDMQSAWPIGAAAAFLWFVIAFAFHHWIIDAATGAGSVTRIEAPKLYNALENLCIARGIPMPALKIIETPAANAYASGLRERRYAITVTRGLIDTLTEAEIEAVLGHELTHIRNRDTQMMVVAVIFAGIFAFVGDLLIRSWQFPYGLSQRHGGQRGSNGDRRRSDDSSGAILAILVAVAVILISWGVSTLIRFAISRSREFLADAGSVELTKNPDAMISALRKISANATIPDVPSRMHAFFIESPQDAPAESGWLATHPALQDRIEALKRYAGGHET